jgi:hypothetical protein
MASNHTKCLILHEIEAADYQKRLDFCCWVNGLPNNAIEWFIFSDESYFELTSSIFFGQK